MGAPFTWTEPPPAGHPWARRVAFVSCGVAVGTLWTVAAGLSWTGEHAACIEEVRGAIEWYGEPYLGVGYVLRRTGLALAWAAAIYAMYGVVRLRLTPDTLCPVKRLARIGAGLSVAVMLTCLDLTRRMAATFDYQTSAAGHIVDTQAAALLRAVDADGPLAAAVVIALIAMAGRLGALVRGPAWMLQTALLAAADAGLCVLACLTIVG